MFVSLSQNRSYEELDLEALGFWKVSTPRRSGCSAYPVDFYDLVEDGDLVFKIARGMSLVATILGGLGFLFFLASSACAGNVVVASSHKLLLLRSITMLSFFLSALCQGLSLLLVLRSDACRDLDCEWDLGAFSAVAACIYWSSASLALRLAVCNPPQEEEEEDA